MAGASAVFPVDPWKIREIAFEPRLVARNETIFSLGNGSLGMRGNFEEGHPAGVPGTFVNGFYDETPIVYGEIASGYARNRQVMLNVADGKRISLLVDGEPFALSRGEILSYERCLDLAAGLLTRRVRWRSPRGAEIEVVVRRLVSLARPHVAAIEWSVRRLGGAPTLVLESSIDGDVTNQSSSEDPRLGARFPHPPLSTTHAEADGMDALLMQETRSTRLLLACAAAHTLDTGSAGCTPEAAAGPARAVVRFRVGGDGSTPVRLWKFLGYCTTLEHSAGDVAARARDAAVQAREAGFEALAAEQRERCERFWQAADVFIDGDDALQQGLRFNLFSLFQSAGRDGRTSIAAKGLTGQGYEGHYFWDTEIYVQPFFVYTQPEIARALLRYRCFILDKARARAAEMTEKGALFPWRTIGGEETSPYYPAGTAQYHINADIVHALCTYLRATGDRSLLREGGAELLFETARLWAGLGFFNPRKGGAFCINEVTGPDEYSALVNNNLYTNMMARENLAWAAEVAGELRSQDPREYRRIAAALGLDDSEVEAWGRAAAAMFLPYDGELGIHAQDDSFLDLARWDLAGTPAERFPLLMHFHPLVIYRHQVLKQPDVVLAQVLLGSRFSTAQKKRNFDYYDPLTTGDSSLAPCIQSVAAAELGYADKAYAYFSRTARMDLDDVNGNVEDGVHTAAMAGTWVSVVRGFAGMRDDTGIPCFSPRLPDRWRALRFRLRVHGRLLQVALTHDSAVYQLLEGDALSIMHRGRACELGPGAAISFSLSPVLECVIFDLDGVLTDTAELHYNAWKRLADEERFPFDRRVNEKLKGVGREECMRIILREAGVTRDQAEQAALAGRKNSYYRGLISTMTPGQLLPGMEDLLKELRARGIRTAIASVSHNAADIVGRLGIRSLLDLVMDPRTVQKGKPDPEIFMSAAEQLGVPFQNCVGVEDAQAGIQAIKSAGMFAVGIGTDLPGSDWLLPDTRGLTLETLLSRFSRSRGG